MTRLILLKYFDLVLSRYWKRKIGYRKLFSRALMIFDEKKLSRKSSKRDKQRFSFSVFLICSKSFEPNYEGPVESIYKRSLSK